MHSAKDPSLRQTSWSFLKDPELSLVQIIRSGVLGLPLISHLIAHQDFVDPITQRPVLIGRSKGITSRSKQISSDLSCLWVGVDEDANGNTQQNSQHGTFTCCQMMRRTIDVVIPIADATFPYPSPLWRISITATSLSSQVVPF